jgi:hypothetical protein
MSVLGAGLTLVWLAVLPCQGLEREAAWLEEVATSTPEALELHLDALQQRWDGMPLRSPTDDTQSGRVRTALQRMRGACASLDAAREEQALPGSNRERLRDILSRPEFAQARQRQGDLAQRLMRLVREWLEELLQTRGAQSFATGTRTAVLALSVALVLFVVLRLRSWRRGPVRGGSKAAPSAAALALDSPGEHLGRARAALSSQPREAIREGLLALLSALEARKLARPDRVKTNRELVAELPGRGAPPQITQEVERLVRWYDRTFYSLTPVPAEDAARFVEEVERLNQGLAGAAP